MGTPYDRNSLVGHAAEGNAERALDTQSKFGFNNSSSGSPTFVRVVIIDVIADPAIIDEAKLSHWEHDLKVSNTRYAAVAPRNSIIGRRILGNGAAASEKTMVFYPFFPSHLALPCKPGEHVWVMFENPDAKVNDIGYWMCRIVDPHFVDDTNHSHSNRQFDSSFHPGTIALSQGRGDPKYEFPNGVVGEKSGERYTIGETATIPDDEKAYEKLLTNSDASKIAQYEPVPRYRKRPSDTALEGSNNTLIVLGTDRQAALADYDTDPDLGKTPKPHNSDLIGSTGLIDLVAGRGQTPSTGGKSVDNSLGRKELGKSREQVVDAEGDPDLKNDRSRIIVAQRTKVDANFQIEAVVKSHTSKNEISDNNSGDGAIVHKSDKIRLIARQDLVILVTGATSRDGDGRIIDDDPDPSKCASVTLRANGDIIFTPAEHGIIKLGSDTADLAVLCTRVNNGGEGGTVTATGVTDTMGGVQGQADGTNGTFAKKVLLS